MTRSFEAALPATTFTVSLRARRFAFFPGHCELVFSFPKQSRPSGWSLRARLSVCEAISEIPRRFAARNDRSKESLRGRRVVSEAVSKTLVQGQDCFASLAMTEKTSVGLLRAFGPRNDWGKVTASSSFRLRSSLTSQGSLRARFSRLRSNL
jgi:hypothetical protein